MATIVTGDIRAKAKLLARQISRSMPRLRRARLLNLVVLIFWAASAMPTFAANGRVRAASDTLVMFEQEGCPYCAAWNRDVGRIYPKTDEAKLLPLRRVDIHATRPADLRGIGGVRFTPTFVVMHCGREFARITGYLGDEQFWGLLDQSVKSIKESPACPN